jgi:riboflavin kinase/FMN adenylyltransferase
MRVVVLQGGAVSDAETGKPVVLDPLPSAVTIGSYDGLHVGHRMIIGAMIDDARSKGLRSVVVTFEPHPRIVLDKGTDCPVRLLTTFEEKVAQFSSMPIDLLFVIRFDAEFSRKSSESFIREILVRLLGAKLIVIGYDHGFGSDRRGSGQTLHTLALECGFEVDVVGEVIIDKVPVSSTRIRHLLAAGQIKEANACLGAPYMISGIVVQGSKLGRTLGFPTANLDLSDRCKMLPVNGVYAAEVTVDGAEYPVMVNIGSRPTVSNDGIVKVEAHIIGFSGDLYGRHLALRLVDFIRPEQRFVSLEELRKRLLLDQKEVGFYKK